MRRLVAIAVLLVVLAGAPAAQAADGAGIGNDTLGALVAVSAVVGGAVLFAGKAAVTAIVARFSAPRAAEEVPAPPPRARLGSAQSAPSRIGCDGLCAHATALRDELARVRGDLDGVRAEAHEELRNNLERCLTTLNRVAAALEKLVGEQR